MMVWQMLFLSVKKLETANLQEQLAHFGSLAG
jgi:hypothetical protein